MLNLDLKEELILNRLKWDYKKRKLIIEICGGEVSKFDIKASKKQKNILIFKYHYLKKSLVLK